MFVNLKMNLESNTVTSKLGIKKAVHKKHINILSILLLGNDNYEGPQLS